MQLIQPPQPFNKVTDKLYQGRVPDPASNYDGFTMLVLCAKESQPELPLFKGMILRPAFDDTSHPTADDLDRASKAATEVAAELMRGGRVLVTCHMGLNRSGLVTGIALTLTTTMSATEIMRHICAARGPHALSNSAFARAVASAAAFRDQVLGDALHVGLTHPRDSNKPKAVSPKKANAKPSQHLRGRGGAKTTPDKRGSLRAR
jgi:predicted protein tyrosine phosphatase